MEHQPLTSESHLCSTSPATTSWSSTAWLPLGVGRRRWPTRRATQMWLPNSTEAATAGSSNEFGAGHPHLNHLASFEVSALVQWLPLDVRLPLVSEPGSRLARRLAKRGLEEGVTTSPNCSVTGHGVALCSVSVRTSSRSIATPQTSMPPSVDFARQGAQEGAHCAVRGVSPDPTGHHPRSRARSQSFDVAAFLRAAGVILAELHTDVALPLLPQPRTTS